jgi:hypothetical protein
MARRALIPLLVALLAVLGLGGAVYAQLESGERGIPPIDSSGTLEITGIDVDVTAKDAQSARYEGWRIAQRQGFKALWGKMHNRPASEAPSLPDSTLDGLVSSIVVEREQIGPNRYIARLGILFDRARSAELLGVGGEAQRSVPMLLMPVMITAGTATSVELRNSWQRAWAEFRTSQSPIDYVRVSGLGVDPLLVNAAQTHRPGRGWWRNIIDYYGAADILTVQVQLHRAYPGGPAVARFVGFHGPDREPIGTFTLTARDSAAIPEMMRQGVQRMDALFAAALAAGRLVRDPTLDIPQPPVLVDEEPEPEAAPTQQAAQPWVYQVQIVSPDVHTYNFAMAHLRTVPGVDQTVPIAINPGGISYVNVTYRGDLSALQNGLAARGWNVERLGYVLRVSRIGAAPPPIPQPAPQPQPLPPPQAPQPAQPQPGGGPGAAPSPPRATEQAEQ